MNKSSITKNIKNIDRNKYPHQLTLWCDSISGLDFAVRQLRGEFIYTIGSNESGKYAVFTNYVEKIHGVNR